MEFGYVFPYAFDFIAAVERTQMRFIFFVGTHAGTSCNGSNVCSVTGTVAEQRYTYEQIRFTRGL